MDWQCTSCGHSYKGKSPDCPLHKAAPDLLAELEKLHKQTHGNVFCFDNGQYCCSAGEAISKAKGKPCKPTS